MRKDWKEIGDQISIAVGIQGNLTGIEDEIADCQSQIDANKKEMDRLDSLKAITKTIEDKQKSLKAELAEGQAELNKVLAKIEKAGGKMPPINEPGAKQVNL